MSAVAQLRPEDPLGLMAAVLFRRAAEGSGRAVPQETGDWTEQGALKTQALTAPAGEESNTRIDEATLLKRVSCLIAATGGVTRKF